MSDQDKTHQAEYSSLPGGEAVNTVGPEPHTQALTLVLLRLADLTGGLCEILLCNILSARQL